MTLGISKIQTKKRSRQKKESLPRRPNPQAWNKESAREKGREREEKEKSVIYGGRLLLHNIAFRMTSLEKFLKNDKHLKQCSAVPCWELCY